MCKFGDENNIDSFSFLYYNLWKNEKSYRIDELWNKNWQNKLWKNTGNLCFDTKEGLHLRQFPLGLKNERRTNVKLIHFGFSTEDKINKKYLTYKKLGQSGNSLERIKDEKGISLRPFVRDWFPLSTQKIVVVVLIYKSINYLNFVYDSFRKYTKDIGKNVEFLFIANDPTEQLLNYLRENNLLRV